MAEDIERVLPLSSLRSDLSVDDVDAPRSDTEGLGAPKGDYVKGWPLHIISLA